MVQTTVLKEQYSWEKLATAINRDGVVCTLLTFIQNGFPKVCPKDTIQPFWLYHHAQYELYDMILYDNCIARC